MRINPDDYPFHTFVLTLYNFLGACMLVGYVNGAVPAFVAVFLGAIILLYNLAFLLALFREPPEDAP